MNYIISKKYYKNKRIDWRKKMNFKVTEKWTKSKHYLNESHSLYSLMFLMFFYCLSSAKAILKLVIH